jgi:flagellar basal body-associated protein FliL
MAGVGWTLAILFFYANVTGSGGQLWVVLLLAGVTFVLALAAVLTWFLQRRRRDALDRPIANMRAGWVGMAIMMVPLGIAFVSIQLHSVVLFPLAAAIFGSGILAFLPLGEIPPTPP